MSKGPGLCEFLIEAELQQYFAAFKNDLKIQNVGQLKFVTEEDLQQLGMSKPEMRRLKKYFQKHFPQTYLHKLKKMIMPKKEEPWENITLPEEPQEKPPVKVPNKHIIPAEAIIVNKELGTGEFGVVQQGVWTNDGDRIQVAIKCLSRERMQNNPIEFLKEAAIMHSIDHEHIVRLYGVVLDTNALMLVTELAALRSLLECLKEPSLRSSFPILSLCSFAIQICDGMQYLEAKRLIHRDLAARNILVFSKNKVKISDFGLSRALGVGKDYYQTNFNVNLKLPIAWCAPECITYLKFTSASDVWAYAVTLWEMFSYGFQPWAALTGQQILEAIDLPNSQRLERPECCPKEYYSLMKKCWHHDPNKRPRFADLMRQLPECKPEQVQAIQDSGESLKRDLLLFRSGEVITVLDKNVAGCGSALVGGSLTNGWWKGCTNSGKAGLFNPALTVSYLGSNLPSNKPSTPSEFTRGDGKNVYSSKRRLRPDMISCPQGDVKHTGHVGLDGAYFGDIFCGSKYEHIPHQVVSPYKPQTDVEDSNGISTDKVPLISSNSKSHTNGLSNMWMEGSSSSKLLTTDHEYHEISDEDTPADSPRFEKQFDFGRSLMDEMNEVLRNYSCPPQPSSSSSPPQVQDDLVNRSNEMKEAATAPPSKPKKKQATVKPISAADEKSLDTAIALANEIAARSMASAAPVSPSATTPPPSASKHKFTFKFPGTGSHSNGSGSHKMSGTLRSEGRTFTDEAASIPDIQGILTSEAKQVYSSLVEAPVASSDSPLRMLRSSAPLVRPKGGSLTSRSSAHTLPLKPSTYPLRQTSNSGSASCLLTSERKRSTGDPPSETEFEDHHNAGIGCGSVDGGNPVPLPPRDRSRSLLLVGSKPRHERKYPLIIPTTVHGPLRHHSAQESEAGYVGLDDDQVFEEDKPKEPLPEPAPLQDTAKPVRSVSSKEEAEGFEERIANDFDLLDAMSEETDDENREPVDDSSIRVAAEEPQFDEALRPSRSVELESVENTQSCTTALDRSTQPFETELEASPKPFEASVKPYEINVHFESSTRPFETSQSFETTVKPFDPSVKHFETSVKPFEASIRPFDPPAKPSEPSKSFETLSKLSETSKVLEASVKPYDASVKPFETSTPSTAFDTPRSFEPCTRSFESCKVPEVTGCGIPMARVEPHSTLEHQEEAQSKRPSVNEIAERLSNFDAEMSSQLSIMTKVLQNKVSEADCLRALECTGGNVHRSIKLARLMSLVGVSSRSQPSPTKTSSTTGTPEQLLSALEASSWDIAAAAASYLATQPPNI